MKKQILLVEDDELDVISVKRSLNKLDHEYKLHVAYNGKEALTMLRQEEEELKPDVILLDLNMPKMNGLEFLEEIRKDPFLKDLNVFIMTTSSEDTDRLAAQHLNVSGYIEKPLTFDSFGGRNGSSIDSFSLFLDLLKLK